MSKRRRLWDFVDMAHNVKGCENLFTKLQNPKFTKILNPKFTKLLNPKFTNFLKVCDSLGFRGYDPRCCQRL